MDVKKIIVGGLVSLLLSLTCMWVIVRITGAENLQVNLSTIGLNTILISLLMVVASWVVDSLKLKILTTAMGGHIGLWGAFRITVAGSFVAGITPFDSGGEPLKVYFLHKRDLSIGSATAVVTMGALLHGISRFILWLISPLLLIVTGTSLAFSATAKTTIAVGVSLYVLLMGFVIAMALWPQWVEVVTEKLFGLKAVRKLVPQSLVTTIPVSYTHLANYSPILCFETVDPKRIYQLKAFVLSDPEFRYIENVFLYDPWAVSYTHL